MNPPIHKESVMWKLDDMNKDDLPSFIRNAIPSRCTKPGRWVRMNRPELFSRYYNQIAKSQQ